MCEDIAESISSVLVLRDYLTLEEELQIHRQFRSGSWKPNSQALWSGMLRKEAQRWADEHDMQTLTTAMGLLMDPSLSDKPSKGWSKYIHGASAIFAWHIAKNERTTVLCPPPPQRFHPSGRSYFQLVEEPILRAAIATGAALCIEMVHPGVTGAENCHYQLWPLDEADRWVAIFGTASCRKIRWRMVKSDLTQASLKKGTSPKKSKKRKKTMASTANSGPNIAAPSPSGSTKLKLEETVTYTSQTVADGPIASRTRSKTKAREQLRNSALSENNSIPTSASNVTGTIPEEKQEETNIETTTLAPVKCSPKAKAAITVKRISKTKKAEKSK